MLRAVAILAGLALCCMSECAPAQASPAERALAALCPHAVAWAPLVDEAAHRQLLHPALLVAVMLPESGCQSGAVSRKGARGPMQLLGVARGNLRGDALHDPAANINAGARWLALREVECGSLFLGLGAYNAGPCGKGKGYARRVLDLLARCFNCPRRRRT